MSGQISQSRNSAFGNALDASDDARESPPGKARTTINKPHIEILKMHLRHPDSGLACSTANGSSCDAGFG